MTQLLLFRELGPAPRPRCVRHEKYPRRRRQPSAPLTDRQRFPLLCWNEAPAPVLLCAHCRKYQQTRPRHLCRKCHGDPRIRQLHPPVSAWGRRGFDCRGARRLAASATKAPPGSAEKVQVLIDRADQHVALFHPGDAPMDVEADGWPSWWWEG